MTAIRLTPHRNRAAILTIALCAIAYVVWVALAPAESTIGDRIKTVIVHVTWTWVGMAGLALAGALGIVQALRPAPRLARIAALAAVLGFATYAIGTLISLLAQQQTWGAIAWEEPRTRAAFQVIAFGVIVLALGELGVARRIVGALYALLALFLFWATANAAPVMHPNDAVNSSSSSMLQAAFYGPTIFLALIVLIIGWLWYNHRRT